MNRLVTPFDAGKNYIPDDSGSGSATLGQFESLPLNHEPNVGCCLCSISVTKMYIRVI